MTISVNNEEMKQETYMTKVGFFLYDSINQQWIQSQKLLDTLNFTFLVEPDEITIEQKVEANYSKYNEIQEIVLTI